MFITSKDSPKTLKNINYSLGTIRTKVKFLLKVWSFTSRDLFFIKKNNSVDSYTSHILYGIYIKIYQSDKIRQHDSVPVSLMASMAHPIEFLTTRLKKLTGFMLPLGKLLYGLFFYFFWFDELSDPLLSVILIHIYVSTY